MKTTTTSPWRKKRKTTEARPVQLHNLSTLSFPPKFSRQNKKQKRREIKKNSD